jgi:hypothetical protein
MGTRLPATFPRTALQRFKGATAGSGAARIVTGGEVAEAAMLPEGASSVAQIEVA